MKKAITSLVVASALAAPGAAAAAAPPDYKGKTKEGSKISVWNETTRGYVSLITSVPTSCVSAQGGNPLALMTSFNPPFAFKVGRVDKATVKGNPTKHYTVQTRRKGKRLVGKISVNYSRLSVSDFGGFYILTCQGTANFDLKRR